MKFSNARNVKNGQFVGAAPKERFDKMYEIDRVTGCWNWIGSLFRTGYARFVGGGEVVAHRWAYSFYKNIRLPKSRKIVLDHLCRNRSCVNPDHMELVSQKENILRGNTAKRFKDQTHCKYGHNYAETGYYISGVNGNGRQCKPCVMRRYYLRKAKTGSGRRR